MTYGKSSKKYSIIDLRDGGEVALVSAAGDDAALDVYSLFQGYPDHSQACYSEPDRFSDLAPMAWG
jgi:hypothetical protein